MNARRKKPRDPARKQSRAAALAAERAEREARRAAIEAERLEKARLAERDADTGGDTGPAIRQGRDVEMDVIPDPDPKHDPSARAAAVVRVRRVKDVLTYERATRRSITKRHTDAATRLLDDYEIGAEGGTPPRSGRGQSSGEYDSEQRRLDALGRFLAAKEAILLASPLHDAVMWIVLRNRSVEDAAAFYRRREDVVRGLLASGLETLACWYEGQAKLRRAA